MLAWEACRREIRPIREGERGGEKNKAIIGVRRKGKRGREEKEERERSKEENKKDITVGRLIAGID